MSDEEKQAIGWLSALDISSESEATNKIIILSLIEKQYKIMNYLAKIIEEQKLAVLKRIQDNEATMPNFLYATNIRDYRCMTAKEWIEYAEQELEGES